MEVVLRAVDRHEALQDVLVQDTFREFGALVGHEAVDEGERSLGDDISRKRTVEKDGIFGDGFVESMFTEIPQDFQVVVRRTGIGLSVVEIEELGHDEPAVAAVLAQVCPQGRAVGFVVAVRATDADARSSVNAARCQRASLG